MAEGSASLPRVQASRTRADSARATARAATDAGSSETRGVGAADAAGVLPPELEGAGVLGAALGVLGVAEPLPEGAGGCLLPSPAVVPQARRGMDAAAAAEVLVSPRRMQVSRLEGLVDVPGPFIAHAPSAAPPTPAPMPPPIPPPPPKRPH